MNVEAISALWRRPWRRWPRPKVLATVDPRNRRMLQAILVIVGTLALVATVIARSPADAAQPHEARTAAITAGYAWLCFGLVCAGYYRLSASLTVLGSLLLIGGSYYQYGLQAQPDLLIFPLLFAGLLLGRTAVWWTALASGLLLPLGAWSDMQTAASTGLVSDDLPTLLFSAMNFLALAVILDRLILSSQRAMARSKELQVAYTNLKRESREKELAYERLLHTQRLEAVGRLSAGVAHDFNHILSVILGLATSPAAKSGSEIVLPGIQKAAQRGVMLTRRLLSFSRTQSRCTVQLNLGEAIEEVRTLIQPMFHPGIRASFNLPSTELCVVADRDELELVLLNLASNASDAMPKGGRFALTATAEGDQALIRVEDSGIGMPSDVIDRMFEPFFTTKPRDEGTGIGMIVVHRFVTESGGNISVHSKPGKGTRIEIRLPLAATETS